ncbi:MAG: hypothetical protein Phog2KO_49470 [Phototrophicaceae bacterium]
MMGPFRFARKHKTEQDEQELRSAIENEQRKISLYRKNPGKIKIPTNLAKQMNHKTKGPMITRVELDISDG